MIRTLSSFLVLSALLVAGGASAAGPACPNCPPEDPRGNVFDATSCVGATLTSAEAAEKFCRGAHQVELADFHYAVRARNCNKHTGCGNWSALSVAKHIGVQGYAWDDFLFGTQTDAGGTLGLQTFSDGVSVNFVSKGFNPGRKGVFNFYTTQRLPATEAGTFLPTSIGYDFAGYVDGLRMTAGNGTNRMSDRAPLYGDGIQFTDHCARFLGSAKTKPDASSSWVEYQIGGLARY